MKIKPRKLLEACFIIAFILNSNIVLSQHQNILVGPTLTGSEPNEPSVAINPNNTNEIIVGANSDNYYISTDGGFTWTHGILRSSFGVSADPCIVADNSGGFYYIHLIPGMSGVVCQKKDNILSNWTDGSFSSSNTSHDHDKEWGAYDAVLDNLYMSWTDFDTWGSTAPEDSSCIFIARSADRGLTWENPVRISDRKGNAMGGNSSVHGSYLTTGPLGEVYISWWNQTSLMFDRSLDGGNTWLEEDKRISSHYITWLYNSFPGLQIGVTFPVIACDRSSERYNGNIYICWAEKRRSNDMDIYLVRSSDNGDNWSDPLKINSDDSGKDQFFPFVTVDQATGKVWVVFYDRRNHINNQTDVYAASSTNGGNSFTDFKISETSFTPNNSYFFSHYNGISAHNNKVIAVWTRMDNGRNSIRGSIIGENSSGIGKNYPAYLKDIEFYPNPFNKEATIKLNLVKATRLSIEITDNFGRTIKNVLSNTILPEGKTNINLDVKCFHKISGIYYLKLYKEDLCTVKKIIYYSN